MLRIYVQYVFLQIRTCPLFIPDSSKVLDSKSKQHNDETSAFHSKLKKLISANEDGGEGNAPSVDGDSEEHDVKMEAEDDEAKLEPIKWIEYVDGIKLQGWRHLNSQQAVDRCITFNFNSASWFPFTWLVCFS